MESTISADTLTTGETISVDIIVENEEGPAFSSALDVATNTIVTINFPPSTSNLASQDCAQTDSSTLVCVLPELNIGAIVNLSASATINAEGYRELIVTLEGDDLFAGGQVEKKRITVEAQTPDLSPVDLEHELTISGNETEVNDFVYVTATVRNLHQTNAAYFPAIELMVPESFQYITSDDCNYSGNSINCELIALPPLSESKTSFALVGRMVDPQVIITGNVNSTQPDEQPQNNASQLITSVIPDVLLVLCGASNPMCAGSPDNGDNDNLNSEQATGNAVETTNPEANSEPETANASDGLSGSGGGSLSLFFFFLLLPALFLGNYRLSKRNHTSSC